MTRGTILVLERPLKVLDKGCGLGNGDSPKEHDARSDDG